jgi:hypothetical protein
MMKKNVMIVIAALLMGSVVNAGTLCAPGKTSVVAGYVVVKQKENSMTRVTPAETAVVSTGKNPVTIGKRHHHHKRFRKPGGR